MMPSLAPPSRPRAAAWLHAAFISVVLACTAVLLAASRSSLRDIAVTESRAVPGSAPYRLLLVQRPEDCGASAEFLEVLQRPALAGRFSVSALLYGSRAELRAAREKLDEAGFAIPLRRASRKEASTLAALGQQQTPFWIVFDSRGNLVLSGPPPVTVAERMRFTRLVHALQEQG